MFEEIENHDLTARLQDAMTRGNRLVRFFRVMKRLAEDDEID